MQEARQVDIKGIGPVLFERSRRARRISITVRPVKGVRVAVPVRVSFAAAMEFARLKKPWIQKHLADFKRAEHRRHNAGATGRVINRAAAAETLVGRLNYLAEKHGFKYNRVYIRNQKTRWGSCSARQNISLNMQLTLLPGELVDYVILHELVHTKIHNHSKKFWAELDRYVGDARAMSKELKRNGLGLL